VFSLTGNFFGLPCSFCSHRSSLFLDFYLFILLKPDAHSAGQMHMLGSIGDQSQMSGPFDRYSYRSLMLGTGTGFAAGIYPSSFGNILAQFAGILVIYYIDLIAAEGANLSFGNVLGAFPLSLWFNCFGVIHSV
jgi:hypothetical protein